MALALVLLVDDDVVLRLDAVEAFEDAGFDVVEACDAESALRMLQDRPDIELVCTDVQMPGELDGIDLAMRVKERHPAIQLIVMSGVSSLRALPPGVCFLGKPFPSTHLVELARQQLACGSGPACQLRV